MALILAGALLLGQVVADLDSLAEQAGVPSEQLQAAADTVGATPYDYLVHEGVIAPPKPAAPSVPSAVAARVACIEAKESGGANIWNRGGSGAGGVMQYMPGTFARGAREMGHPEWSLWNPDQARAVAAHDLLLGRRAQWTVGGC